MARIGPGEKEVAHQVGRRVVDHLDLFQDDSTLPLEFVFREGRVDQHVSQHLESLWKVGLLNAKIEAHDLPGGEGVQDTAHPVEALVNVGVGPGRGSLENEVFHEVAGAVGGRGLLARSALDPHAGRHGRVVRHMLDD